MSLARKKRGFNRLAPRYDALAKLFFGSDLLRATTHFFDSLPPNARVLVVGGGTGNFFEALGRARPDCKVLFVKLGVNGQLLSFGLKTPLRWVVLIISVINMSLSPSMLGMANY